MDYLHLNKPIIFYPYDLDEYIKNSRSIQFEYDWITPGPKCENENELLEEVKNILIKKEDQYNKKREEILEVAFSNVDCDNSKRVWDHIEKIVLSD